MNTYLLFKSIHLIAVISWMAGLLYLPRIFVYHSESIVNKKSEDLVSTFNTDYRLVFWCFHSDNWSIYTDLYTHWWYTLRCLHRYYSIYFIYFWCNFDV